MQLKTARIVSKGNIQTLKIKKVVYCVHLAAQMRITPLHNVYHALLESIKTGRQRNAMLVHSVNTMMLQTKQNVNHAGQDRILLYWVQSLVSIVQLASIRKQLKLKIV